MFARADRHPDATRNLVAAVPHENAAAPQFVASWDGPIARLKEDKVRLAWERPDAKSGQSFVDERACGEYFFDERLDVGSVVDGGTGV